MFSPFSFRRFVTSRTYMFRERSCIISGRSTLQVCTILFFILLFFHLDYLVLPSQSVRQSSFFLSHSMAVFSANSFGFYYLPLVWDDTNLNLLNLSHILFDFTFYSYLSKSQNNFGLTRKSFRAKVKDFGIACSDLWAKKFKLLWNLPHFWFSW